MTAPIEQKAPDTIRRIRSLVPEIAERRRAASASRMQTEQRAAASRSEGTIGPLGSLAEQVTTARPAASRSKRR